MSKVKHVSFEELAENLADLLRQVRDEHTAIVVEYASGEKLVIKPLASTRPRRGKEQSDPALQQPSNQASTPENRSTMGAVYDLDPDSITPG